MDKETIQQFIIDNSQLLAEWDREKNDLIHMYPETTALHSNKKVWWKCEKGHSWDMSADKRLKAKGCPYCLNKRVLVGYNDLATLFPHLAKEWDYTENDIDMNSVVIGGTQKIHWICSNCQHKWVATVRSRTQKATGCPECSRKKRTAARTKTYVKKHGCITNSLLLKEWNYQKNEELGLSPEALTPNSSKEALWTCATCGHEWAAKIANRSNGRGCPLCANKVIVIGINDLCTTHPFLVKEWDYERNGELLPQHVSYGMGKKVGWICPRGHKYKATILHRSSGTNCPICNSGRQTSFAEQAVLYYVKKLYPNAVGRFTDIFDNGMELDIYIPEIRYAIEYDGSFWHQQNKYDREHRKYEICKSHGIKLIRIKAFENEYSTDIPYGADYIYFLKEDSAIELQKMIQSLYFKLYSFCEYSISPSKKWENTVNTVNIDRDRYEIKSYLNGQKDSFADKYPALASEWHPTKNEGLLPSMFLCGSSFVAWWKCSSCGYEWQTSINHRVNGTGCKECQRVSNSGKNHYKARAIYQYTKEGIFIKEWQSISEASRALNINNSNLSMCAGGKRAAAGGYRWSYEYFEALPTLPMRKNHRPQTSQ